MKVYVIVIICYYMLFSNEIRNKQVFRTKENVRDSEHFQDAKRREII